jgi:hypothetical protein
MPVNVPAGARPYAGDAPGSEVSLSEILEHRLVELCFCRKPFEPSVLLLQLGEPFGLYCSQVCVEVVGGLETSRTRQTCNCLALGKQLVSRFELANDLLGCVTGSFHGGIPGPVLPDEDSHSLWTNL